MISAFPSWIGFPGGGPPPGRDWVPGKILRFIVLGLGYGFLTLALTVNYAYSIAFFLLAIIGMYVGFRRGFVNGLTRNEKLVFAIFAAYVGLAIFSFLCGVQTTIGFRFIGRYLRFLLFIPVYLALRWSAPKGEHLGWALAGAAVGAFVIAALQNQPWPAPTPHGVAGTHISFGDLSLAAGFIGAVMLWPENCGRHFNRKCWVRRLGALVAVGTGLLASIVSHARGGWIALPFLILGIFLYVSPQLKSRPIRRIFMSFALFSLLGALVALSPGVRAKLHLAIQNYAAYSVSKKMVHQPCVDQESFLDALLGRSKVEGDGLVKVVKLHNEQRKQVGKLGCYGGWALRLTAFHDARKPLELWLYRGDQRFRSPVKQDGEFLGTGSGAVAIGWRGPWASLRHSHAWERHRVSQEYASTAWLIARVGAGHHMTIIPLQVPPGVFARALAESSVGRRLQMWDAALQLFAFHPLLGVGTGAFQATSAKVLGNDQLSSIVNGYEHAHSDYLTILSTEGIVGLLSLCFLLITPIFGISKMSEPTKPAALFSGRILTFCMAVFGLTETMLIHSLVISWYVVMVSMLMAVSKSSQLKGV